MQKNNIHNEGFTALLNKALIPFSFQITKQIELDPEGSKYDALTVGINDKTIVYRKGKVTPDRPGAFLAIWQRPASQTENGNKPIPLKHNEFDYLIIQVHEHTTLNVAEEVLEQPKTGIFIFPISLLIEKGIVSSAMRKGKTGFRVFPPWSHDRGLTGTKVFSESGKKSQRWQLPYFLELDENGALNQVKLKHLFPV